MSTPLRFIQSFRQRPVRSLGNVIALGWLATLIGVVPGLTALYRWPKLNRAQRSLGVWLMYAAAVGIVIAVLSLQGIRTTPFAQYTFPLFALLGLRALGLLAGDRRGPPAAVALTVIYLTWWTAWMVNGELRADFPTFSAPLMFLMLGGAAAAVLVIRLAPGASSGERRTALLATTGVMISYLPVAAADALASAVYADHSELIVLLFAVRALFQIAGSLLLTMTLWQSTTRP